MVAHGNLTPDGTVRAGLSLLSGYRQMDKANGYGPFMLEFESL